jgi:hypothetical protein
MDLCIARSISHNVVESGQLSTVRRTTINPTVLFAPAEFPCNSKARKDNRSAKIN